MRIVLDKQILRTCENHAKNIVAFYSKRFGRDGSKTYNHNTVASNIVGVKGEVATEKWLREFLPQTSVFSHFMQFRSNANMGDISVGVVSHQQHQQIEIKTLRPKQWSKYKRMIPPKQLKHYIRKNAIVIWAVASQDAHDPNVYLQGWNYARDVVEKGIPIKTICDNIWLKNDADMRDMSKLRELLQKLLLSPAPAGSLASTME